MTDLIEIGKQVLNGGGMAAFIGVLVILAVPNLRKRVFGNGVMSDENTKQLADKMRTNHLHEWGEDIKEIKNDVATLKSEVTQLTGRIAYLEGRLNGKT